MSDLLPCPFCGGEARLFCDDFINGVVVAIPDWVIECEGNCKCRVGKVIAEARHD